MLEADIAQSKSSCAQTFFKADPPSGWEATCTQLSSCVVPLHAISRGENCLPFQPSGHDNAPVHEQTLEYRGAKKCNVTGQIAKNKTSPWGWASICDDRAATSMFLAAVPLSIIYLVAGVLI